MARPKIDLSKRIERVIAECEGGKCRFAWIRFRITAYFKKGDIQETLYDMIEKGTIYMKRDEYCLTDWGMKDG